MSKNDLMDYDEYVTAEEFLASERGKEIVSKALYMGIQSLEDTRFVDRDLDTVNDMKFLRHTVFPSHRPTESIAPWHGG